MTTVSTHLPERALLFAGGADARSFLQGLVTCNMDKVSTAQAQFGALLTPQGKILFDLFIIAHENGLLIETSAAQRDALLKRLQFYRLRANIALTPRDDLKVFALWGENPEKGFADPRWPELGHRLYALDYATTAEAEAYHAHRLVQAIPEAEKDYPLGDTFPHDANFDLLNGVDFSKGCYVGQEVVSRMQHRGEVRKRILPFAVTGEAKSGEALTANGMPLGTLGTIGNGRALATVRIDRMNEARQAGHALVAGTAALTPVQPPWSHFDIKGAA